MPRIKIRNLIEDTATIDGVTLIPVFNYLESSNMNDFNSCPYVDEMTSYNYENKPETVFADVASYIMPVVRTPLGKSQNLNDTQIQALTFKDCYRI